MAKKIIIIGAGAIGLSTAYYLLQEGCQVTIIDDSKDITNCSYGNTGLIVPSHYVPIASPGVIWNGIKWMFKADSPFSIKPSFDFNLLRWLLKFYLSSTDQHVNQSLKALSHMNLDSKILYLELSNKLDFKVESKGLIMLANSKKGLQKELKAVKLCKNTPVHGDYLEKNDIKKLLPNIQVNAIGGTYYKEDAHTNPEEYMVKMNNYLTKNGVEMIHEKVIDFEQKKRKINTVITDREIYSANEIILAAGSKSYKLTKKLGLKLPVIAGKGYSFNINKPIPKIDIPIVLSEERVAITPLSENIRFAGTMELNNTKRKVNYKKVSGMIKAITTYIPNFKPNYFNQINPWIGFRPASSDGLPFIGRSNRINNLIIATGHTMMGMSLAPITGKMIEKIITNKELPFYFKNVDVNRPSLR